MGEMENGIRMKAGVWKDMKLNFLLKRSLTKQDKTEC